MAGNRLKKIRVRKGTMRDIGLFRILWMKLLEEQVAKGSLIKANEHNLAVAAQLFEAYVGEDFDGVVLFVSDVGCLMYGDMTTPYELSPGKKVAYGFGQYVAPEHRGRGILDKMMAEAFKQLRRMGFDVMFGNTLEKDTHGQKAFERGVEQNDGKVLSTGDQPCYVKLS